MEHGWNEITLYRFALIIDRKKCQTGWLKTITFYLFSILKDRSPEWRWCWVCASSGAPREELSLWASGDLRSSQLRWCSLNLRSPHVEVSPWSLDFPPLVKSPGHTRPQHNMIMCLQTLSPNMVTFTGLGIRASSLHHIFGGDTIQSLEDIV